MRIAYIAPYQGPTALNRRPIVRNRSLSAAVKIELIATLLHAASHEVELISQGEVIESRLTFYASFCEPERFHHDIPIHYASVLPIRRLNGVWSNWRTLSMLKERHRANPYDLVMIYNLQGPQLACAQYAVRRLDLPVILEYEDDRFVNVHGARVTGFSLKRDLLAARRLFPVVSGCVAVSPHLLAQLPARIPKLLLRGVVGDDLLRAGNASRGNKRQIALFSGTHIVSNGVAELIDGWRAARVPDWELHITGHGQLSESLRQRAAAVPGIVFHGLVSRPELLRLMASASICMNPHQPSRTPGNVFAFKIVEYLAAGAHVITTPMGTLEQDLEAGITYMPDNAPPTIAATLRRVVEARAYRRTAMEAAQQRYGAPAVAESLDALVRRASPIRARWLGARA